MNDRAITGELTVPVNFGPSVDENLEFPALDDEAAPIISVEESKIWRIQSFEKQDSPDGIPTENRGSLCVWGNNSPTLKNDGDGDCRGGNRVDDIARTGIDGACRRGSSL